MTYQNYKKDYYPKKPVKSFQDLEVYQKLLGNGVEVFKRVRVDLMTSASGRATKTPEAISAAVNEVVSKLFTIALNLPVQIATAHSLRFCDLKKALSLMDEIMRGCNLAVVYLEQYRDICNNKIEVEFFEEQIKSYLAVRGKLLRLQNSWKKFTQLENKKN